MTNIPSTEILQAPTIDEPVDRTSKVAKVEEDSSEKNLNNPPRAGKTALKKINGPKGKTKSSRNKISKKIKDADDVKTTKAP